MKYLVELNYDEQILIKKIAKLQLASIRMIMENDMEDDLTLTCLEAEIEEQGLMKSLRRNKLEFRKLYHTPEYVCSMDEMNLSIIKTVLFKFFDAMQYDAPRKALFRKMLFTSFYKVIPN